MNKCMFLAGVIILLSSSGCKETQIKQSDFTPFKVPVTLSSTAEKAAEKKPWEFEISPKEAVSGEKREGISDEFIYKQETTRPEPSLRRPEYTGEKIDIAFNFDNAELKDVLQIILGEILNVNYILDKRVAGNINLHATGQIHKEELIAMLNTLLYVYDFAIMKDGDLYRILPKAETRPETNIIVYGDKIPPYDKSIIVQIVPLQYEIPKNLNATLRPFMTSVGNVVTHGDSPFIVLVEAASNMEKLLTLIKTFDMPFFAGKAMKFYDFKYVDGKNVAKDLTTLAQSLGAKAGAEGELSFVPFSDSNKLLVVTRMPELLPKIDLWIKNIDVPPAALEEDTKIYVYKVQHQKAETIVPVLTQIYSEKMAAQPKVTGKNQPEAMKIVADPKTNTIVVKALPTDYRAIKMIIEAVDATPQQVFLQALILEIDLDDSLEYKSEWVLDAGSLKLFQLFESENEVTREAGKPTLLFQKGNFALLMDILAKNSNVKILSAPHILVRDEQPAHIQVGEEVPIKTSAGQQQGTTVTFEQIQYRDTGIILTVTPHIAENDYITMDIKQEVSNASETETGVNDSPTFTTRQAETSLVVKSGHTISLGGIIQQRDEKSISKVPLLGDIPYVGNLFKSTSISNVRRELLMLITPYIANDAEEADVLTNAFQQKLKEIEPLITQEAYDVGNY
ncbi:MAG: type II secretion system secretin GspD [Candidatus Brocadia sp.]|nr:putative type II secretion system protein D [Candidatus Brocadia fulgida]MCC6325341.1 type II secretion system secretin GspD [Candidatus Brocadia sp.]UJS22243.1 MAG: type II secretion system secretin GspD [Candidatus Brocadia sp.]